MARDISVVMSLKDMFTPGIKKAQASEEQFKKSLDGLNAEMDRLSRQRGEIKVNIEKAKQELKDATKAFKECGDEQNALRLSNAQFNLDKTQAAFKQTTRDIKNTGKELDTLQGKASKTENQMNGLLTSLAQSALGNMLGQSLSGAASAVVSSAFDTQTGNAINTTLSSTVSGAAIGASVGGAAGAAIGGLVGAISGLINSATAEFKEKDEAFKSAVSDTYSEIVANQAEQLTSGKSIAAARETSLMSFTTLLGDESKAKTFLDGVRELANTTPFLYDDLTGIAKTLQTAGYTTEEIDKTMRQIGDTGAALGIDASGMSDIAKYLAKMRITGKTTTEYIQPLMERGIPVYDYLAESLKTSKEEVQEMLAKGLIPGEKAAKAIADYMGAANEGAMELQSTTLSGLESTLQGWQDEIANARGEGYSDVRKAGLEAQIEWYEGEYGEKLKKAERAIGEWQADLENTQEKTWRDAMMAALDGIEAEGIESGEDVYTRIAAAEADAKAAYIESDAYQSELQANLDLTDSIQAALAPVYEDMGYTLARKQSEGYINGLGSTSINAGYELTTLGTGVVKVTGSARVGDAAASAPKTGLTMLGGGKAYGMGTVPYDNFPALLHQGERVLTAQQAREMDGGSGQITITGNNFTVREDADIDRIATALARQLRSAQYS